MANDNRGGQQRVELHWTAWQPHEGCWLGERLPRLPGLYRIRRVGRNDVDYIGQTGLTLCERQGMLRGVYDERGMPYRDPHTAGPALWALHQAPGCAFEISVMPYTGSHTMRMGLEAVAIAQYRQAHRCSPTIQFGRMPKGYRKSSSNNRQLEAAGKRFRGVPTTGEDASHLSGIPPVGPLSGDPEGPGWCGHAWSAWMTAADVVRVIPSGANGLYRLRVSGRAGLVYVGQGVMCSRIEQHLRKAGKPDEPQGAVFRADTECSWALNDAWHGHRGLELENEIQVNGGGTRGGKALLHSFSLRSERCRFLRELSANGGSQMGAKLTTRAELSRYLVDAVTEESA